VEGEKKMKIRTNSPPTWCPGCFNFQILAGVEAYLKKQKDQHAIVTGIGCHAKMFDYINLPGLNTLHGRVIPTCLGMKIADPKLNVIGFAGDGDAYAEGISHLIHAARYNSDFTYIVHDNQVFALTVSQPTPTTELGYIDKTTPFGVKLRPINPIRFMLASGATFVARVWADVKQIEWILQQAKKHKGFSFIEVIQPCVVFHPDIGMRERSYIMKNHDPTNYAAALKKAEEFDYSNGKGKIPLGIFYQVKKKVFEEII
jgi:2-oxoglutarate ferredoxin oxidoreductase subunit beta